MIRLFVTFSCLLILQGCSLADRFFTTNECEGDNCEAPVLLDNSTPDQKWYCYGTSTEDPWQCQNTEDKNKIVAVRPEPSSNRSSSRVASAPVFSAPAPAAAPMVPAPTQNTNTAIETVLNSPADHFAVQLIALRELEGVLEYASLNGIADPLYVKIRNDQTDWYILLLGVYPDRTLAEAAKREWQTAKVLRVQPWIRKLGGLQEAMRKASS